jgi:uncharacterized peroxidase-related enzyme
MSRIPAIDPSAATGRTSELFTAVKSKLGAVPNLMRTLGHSPATLDAFLGFKAALGGGILSAKVREQIALTVAELNGCEYCLAAHSLVAKANGLTSESILAARRGEAADPKVDSLLKFATAVVRDRGNVSDDAIMIARDAGASDAEIIETVANVALNILTNYTNHVAQPALDFPKAAPLSASGQPAGSPVSV